MADNFISTADKLETVPFSDDSEDVRDDELITDDALKLTNPVEHKARLERRRERSKERESERKKQADELKELREQSAKRDRELAELRGYVVAQANQPKQGAADADPYQAKLDAIEERRTNVYAAYQAEIAAGKMTEARQKHYDKEAREIDDSKVNLMVERQVIRARAEDSSLRQQEQERNHYRSKYPEVFRDPRAEAYARAEWHKRTIALGKAPTDELYDEVMAETKQHFKLGAKPAPTANDKSKFTGISASGNGGGGGQRPTGGIPKTKEFMKMAVALNPDMTEDKAFKVWVDTVGRKLREKGAL